MTTAAAKSLAVKFWQGWIKPFLVVLVVVSTFRAAVADWNDVPTGSMRPSIVEGDRIFVNKCAYGLHVPFTTWPVAQWAQPERFDVVVFFCPEGGQRMVKRVIGLPGETIELRNNVLWVNGRAAVYEPLPDSESANPVLLERLDDIVHPVRTSPRTAAMRNFGPITVPAGEYFLMGDNRDSSRDSRYFGTVPRHVIVGRSSAVVFSLDPDHHYRLRGDRFLHEIP